MRKNFNSTRVAFATFPALDLRLILIALVASLLALGVAVAAFSPVLAVLACDNDTAGANDEPGQKDLTMLCVDTAGLPTSLSVLWNWDETSVSGANTLDACALFDTDGDGNVNFSLCVTDPTDPGSIITVTLYTCGDDKNDRCTSPVTSVPSFSSTCSTSTQATDPFPAGANFPNDRVASCNIVLADVGAASATLLDVCSYPSTEPNSDPSDCVILQDTPPTPTNTPTNTPTDTPTNTPTNTPTSTPTDTPTNTPTNTPTDTPTSTPTNTPTSTPTDTPTNTPTNTPTDTPTNTPTNTPTKTPTNTPTNTPAANLGQLKVCKVAGAGVPVGTLFTLNVNGTPYSVPAGPEDGYCVLAGQFPLNTQVTIQEVIPAGYVVSRIQVVPDGRTVSKNVTLGKVVVKIGTGVTEAIFTNKVSGLPTKTPTPFVTPKPTRTPLTTPTATPAPTGRLQICKEADGSGVTGDFTFTFAGKTRTIPVGACTSLIVVPVGPLTITEVARTGYTVTDIYTIPADRLISENLGARSATVTIVQGTSSTQTIVVFRNRVATSP